MTLTQTAKELLELADEMLRHEGYDAYFPGLDYDSFTPETMLAEWLAANPTMWSPGVVNTCMEIHISAPKLQAQLMAYAMDRGAFAA